MQILAYWTSAKPNVAVYRTSVITTSTVESDTAPSLGVFPSSLFTGKTGRAVMSMYVNLPFLSAFATVAPLLLPTSCQ